MNLKKGFVLQLCIAICCWLSFYSFGQELKSFDNNRVQELIANPDENTTAELEDIIRVNRKNAHDTSFYNTLRHSINYFRRIQDYSRTITYGEELLELTKKLERLDKLGRLYGALTHPYWVAGNYEKHYQASLDAAFFSEKYKDTTSWIISLSGIAGFFYNIDELELALEYNEKAFELNKKYLDFDRRADLLRSRASYLYGVDSLTQALEAANKSMEFATKTRDTIYYYNTVGTIYYYMGSVEEAHKAFDQLLKVGGKDLPLDYLSNYYHFKGLAYFDQEKFSEAKNYLLKAEEGMKQTGALEFLQLTYEKLFEIAEIEKDDRSAFTYLKLSTALEDSLDISRQVSDLAKKYYNNEIVKKEEEKRQAKKMTSILAKKVTAEKEARLYSTIMMIVSIVGFVILVFWGINYRKLQRVKRQKMQRQFSDKMELKNKQLASVHVRNMNRSNHIKEVDSKLSEISGKISAQPTQDNSELEDELKRVKRMLDSDAQLDWDDFRYYFEQINDDYFDRVRERHPNITTNDEKIIAFTKIGLDNRQISQLLNVTQATVHTQRYRLRKKLKIDSEVDLRRYFDTEFRKEG